MAARRSPGPAVTFEQLELSPAQELGAVSCRTLPPDQHMARVRAEEPTWQEFRTLAKEKGRSVADYLGWLVQKELNRAERTTARRVLRAEEPHEEPAAEAWVPPWEI